MLALNENGWTKFHVGYRGLAHGFGIRTVVCQNWDVRNPKVSNCQKSGYFISVCDLITRPGMRNQNIGRLTLREMVCAEQVLTARISTSHSARLCHLHCKALCVAYSVGGVIITTCVWIWSLFVLRWPLVTVPPSSLWNIIWSPRCPSVRSSRGRVENIAT